MAAAGYEVSAAQEDEGTEVLIRLWEVSSGRERAPQSGTGNHAAGQIAHTDQHTERRKPAWQAREHPAKLGAAHC